MVEVKLNSHSIHLLVKDNGKGFDANALKTGNGLYNMNKKQINGKRISKSRAIRVAVRRLEFNEDSIGNLMFDSLMG